MKTVDKPSIADMVMKAEEAMDKTPEDWLTIRVWFYLAVAVIKALCEIADAIYQVAADLPSHDR